MRRGQRKTNRRTPWLPLWVLLALVAALEIARPAGAQSEGMHRVEDSTPALRPAAETPDPKPVSKPASKPTQRRAGPAPMEIRRVSPAKGPIRTQALTMTGLGVDELVISTDALQMTGLGIDELVISTDALKMTGLGTGPWVGPAEGAPGLSKGND
jgi:hypothetical protein